MSTRAGASLQTLLRRTTYGGRKGRRAWLRLGSYYVSDLRAAGISVDILLADEPVPEPPYIIWRARS